MQLWKVFFLFAPDWREQWLVLSHLTFSCFPPLDTPLCKMQYFEMLLRNSTDPLLQILLFLLLLLSMGIKRDIGRLYLQRTWRKKMCPTAMYCETICVPCTD